MSVLDELGKRAAKMGQNVADEARKISETARLNDQIKEEKRRLEQLFVSLGRSFFDEMRACDTSGTPHHTLLEQVKVSLARIENLELEEKTLRGVKNCVQCNQELDITAGFCSNCGSAQPIPKPPVQPTKVFCKNCGRELGEDSRFCLSCGTRVE